MGAGILQVNVCADNIGRPVKDALVIVSGNGVNTTMRTDENGRSEKIVLKSPDKKYALENQMLVLSCIPN